MSQGFPIQHLPVCPSGLGPSSQRPLFLYAQSQMTPEWYSFERPTVGREMLKH